MCPPRNPANAPPVHGATKRKNQIMSTTRWPPKLAMTIPEFIVASGFSERAVRRDIASGKLRAAYVNGQWRIRPEDGERLLQGLPPLPGAAPRPRVVSVRGA